MAGITVEHTGYWRIDVSLSSENLDQGIEATQTVVREFVEGGIILRQHLSSTEI